MFCMLKLIKYPAYYSKCSSKCEEQVTLLIIPNTDGWHYIAVKVLSALLIGIKSNYNSDYWCLNCFHSFRTKNRFNLIKSMKK